MSIDFGQAQCQDKSSVKLFGLCDDPDKPKERAYLAETDGGKWIATVDNEDRLDVTFTAIDHCIETMRPDGTMDNRCDGFLFYNNTVIFVELKDQNTRRNEWVEHGEIQLRRSIINFEQAVEMEGIHFKRAYIANKARPKFKEFQAQRMEKFKAETGYLLRIENRIRLTQH